MKRVEYKNLSEQQLEKCARRLACILGRGDVLFLIGDLGAGKSTFARALIRAISGDDTLEVPSPTFPLLIPYQTPRFEISHYDLYRVSDVSELEELGLYDDLEHRLTLIEWPDEMGLETIENRLEISLIETQEGASRTLKLTAFGELAAKLSRLTEIENFLEQAAWCDASWAFLQGDASTRSYIRLSKNGEQRLLMNAPPQPDGPPIKDGKPYSEIAHLAEDMTSFVGIANALRQANLTAPEIFQHDIKSGLLLLSDFGDDQFYDLITSGKADQKTLLEQAIDVLTHLRNFKPGKMNIGDDTTYHLPAYDNQALTIEADLTIDWYWPHVKQTKITEEQRAQYHAIWQDLFAPIQNNANHWVLRDYHSPNLMKLSGKNTLSSVGIIDFQDAVKGHAAYDVLSLCQDARITVSPELEQHLLSRYISKATQIDPSFDAEDFQTAYATLGAQRSSKLLGIFIRLAIRDGKKAYLAHIPRIWDYLERNLAAPHLASLKNWYDTNFPKELRSINSAKETTREIT